ncbi:hypothetical protein [Lysinibacillus odysseyi]|uniref:Uncharacterized protein n=2 Tax=Lysinibacillus odysseyi TaxID=202611 RepID=A0A0A3IIZ2_9BACI|nr:hypothetical protein [Lysinibacillus odysseyi]KGR82768.1 hypothetical protein CD32_18160 [Lysinibacillus odysseyi 34hs-1 = NBRC 100172]
MLHTFQMNIGIKEEDLNTLEETVGGNYKQVNDYIQMHYAEYFNNAFTVRVVRHPGKIYLSLVVDVILLLRKSDIQESDYLEVKQRIMELLMMLIGHAPYEDHILVRIDYRYDVILPNKQLRELYFHLITKHVDRYRFQHKYKGKKSASGEFEKYKTTIYHSSGSIVTTAYDKEAEREAKECETQVYEKDVVRFEVRLMYQHLYYKASARCPNPISMHLSNYFKEEPFNEYLQKYLIPIYPQGDYYKYSEAERIICDSQLSAFDKSLLKEFLLKTSSHSLSTPKKHVSPHKYKKAMRLLQNLGINPVCIPKNYPKAPKQFDNPLNSLFSIFE